MEADRTYIFVGPGAVASYASWLFTDGRQRFDANSIVLIDHLAQVLSRESGIRTEVVFASEEMSRFRSMVYGRADEAAPNCFQYESERELQGEAQWNALAAWARKRGNVIGLWLGSQRYEGSVELGSLETDKLNGFTGRDYYTLLAALDIRDNNPDEPADPPGEQGLSLTPSFIERHKAQQERPSSRGWRPGSGSVF